MPKINISTHIRKQLSVVYSILKNVERFPQFMRDVKEIKVIRKISDKEIITKWKVDIDGTPVEWTEEDIFNDNERKLKFRMLEGDFDKYEGIWTLMPTTKGTRIILDTYLEWGVPNFEKYIGHVLEKKACKSIKSMLWLIRKKAHERK